MESKVLVDSGFRWLTFPVSCLSATDGGAAWLQPQLPGSYSQFCVLNQGWQMIPRHHLKIYKTKNCSSSSTAAVCPLPRFPWQVNLS